MNLNVASFLAALAALGATLVGAYFQYVAIKNRRIVVNIIHSAVPLLNHNAQVGHELELVFAGKTLKNAHLLDLEILNIDKRDVTSLAFDSGSALVVDVGTP